VPGAAGLQHALADPHPYAYAHAETVEFADALAFPVPLWLVDLPGGQHEPEQPLERDPGVALADRQRLAVGGGLVLGSEFPLRGDLLPGRVLSPGDRLTVPGRVRFPVVIAGLRLGDGLRFARRPYSREPEAERERKQQHERQPGFHQHG